MKTLKRIIWVVLVGISVAPAWANSKLINVQGKITNSSGQVLSGKVVVTFRLYKNLNDPIGNAVWVESQGFTAVNGLFNLTLGNVTALDSLPFNIPYYLGMQVAGDSHELTPRQLLGASAYSLGSLGDFNVQGSAIVNSSVTVSGSVTAGSENIINNLNVGGTILASSTVVNGPLTSSAETTSNLTVNGPAAANSLSVNGNISAANISGTGTISAPQVVGTSLFISNNNGGNSSRLNLAGSDPNHYIYSTGQQDMYFGEYYGSFNFVDSRTGNEVVYMKGNAVGINVNTAPRATLDVNGRTRITGPLASGLSGGDEMFSGSLRVVGTNDVSNGRLTVLQLPNTDPSYLTDRYFIIGYDGTGTQRFIIRGDGSYWSASTKAIKTDIQPIPQSLDIISGIQGVYYRLKGQQMTEQREAGFIAEDLAKIFPEAVDLQNHVVNYSAVIPVLVESIKELKAQVETLQKQVTSLQTK